MSGQCPERVMNCLAETLRLSAVPTPPRQRSCGATRRRATRQNDQLQQPAPAPPRLLLGLRAPGLKKVGRDDWSSSHRVLVKRAQRNCLHRRVPIKNALRASTACGWRVMKAPAHRAPAMRHQRKSSVKGNSRLGRAGETRILPGVCPMRKKRAKRRLSAS